MFHAKTQRTRVLVVDDETVIALTTAAILRQEGYETATAFDGDAAIEAAHSFQPHLLLTDICMPARDGIDTACEVLAFCPDCEVVFLSGHAYASDLIATCVRRSSVLVKPVDPGNLLRTVASVLGREKLPCVA